MVLAGQFVDSLLICTLLRVGVFSRGVLLFTGPDTPSAFMNKIMKPRL